MDSFFSLVLYGLKETLFPNPKLCIAETNRAVSKAFLRLVEKSSRCKQRRFIDWGNLIPHNPWQHRPKLQDEFQWKKVVTSITTTWKSSPCYFVHAFEVINIQMENKQHLKLTLFSCYNGYFFLLLRCHVVKVSYHCLQVG